MSDLISCSIIEKDKNGDLCWVWTFPCILQEQRDFIERKYNLDNIKDYIYGRWKKTWFYINKIDCDSEEEENRFFIGVVILTKEFSPDKYRILSSLLCKTYHETDDPTKVLQLYLNAFTKDIDSNENGSLLFKEYCSFNSFTNSKIKEMINMFGLEIIVIYNALLLKRKLIIYHHNLSTLLEWLKSFPCLVIHRKLDEILFPCIELTEDEIQELNCCSYYIAGCCDNTIFSRPELYDVLVNLPAKEITVAQHSKDKLPMTKAHKEIALFMEQLGKSDLNDEKVVKSIWDKTEEIITRLRSYTTLLGDGNYELSIATLRDSGVPSTMQNFLIQLASSESILVIGE